MDGTYIDQMLQTLTSRLYKLKLQAATYGIDAPPHVSMEIDSIEAHIKQVEMGSKSLISVELLERMEPAERWKRLYDSIWEIEIILYTLQKNVEADRLRLQSRHREFNIAIQRNIFEIELLKRNQRKMYYIFAFLAVLVAILLYVH